MLEKEIYNSLRIGNLLKYKNKIVEVRQVPTSNFVLVNAGYLPVKDLEPILLDKEILGRICILNQENFLKDKVQIWNLGDSLFYFKDICVKFTSTNDFKVYIECVEVQIKYLNEIQNLYEVLYKENLNLSNICSKYPFKNEVL